MRGLNKCTCDALLIIHLRSIVPVSFRIGSVYIGENVELSGELCARAVAMINSDVSMGVQIEIVIIQTDRWKI